MVLLRFASAVDDPRIKIDPGARRALVPEELRHHAWAGARVEADQDEAADVRAVGARADRLKAASSVPSAWTAVAERRLEQASGCLGPRQSASRGLSGLSGRVTIGRRVKGRSRSHQPRLRRTASPARGVPSAVPPARPGLRLGLRRPDAAARCGRLTRRRGSWSGFTSAQVRSPQKSRRWSIQPDTDTGSASCGRPLAAIERQHVGNQDLSWVTGADGAGGTCLAGDVLGELLSQRPRG